MIPRVARHLAASGVVALALGCRGAMPPAQERDAARPAVLELREGRFAAAAAKASAAIEADGRNRRARLVRAIARYVEGAQRVYGALFVARRLRGDALAKLRPTLEREERALESIAEDLEAASDDPSLELELCLACWRVDWDQDGVVDEDDARLLEIEIDADGRPIPEDDPRRRPTFRFDAGDVHWARSMVSFQRAAIDLALGVRFEDLESRELPALRIADAGRVRAARGLLLAGLEEAGRAREAYLAETDDDREWVPSPRQASHPLPLPVDEALYETWAGVLGDARRLIESDEGLDVAELLRLSGARAKVAPRGYLDVGRLLSSPRDLRVDDGVIRGLERAPDAALEAVFGDAYVRSMRASPLPKRLARMRAEVARGDESLARKLKYLFWLN